MRPEFNQLIEGNITQAYNTLMYDRMGEMWPALPFIALIMVIRITTKSDAITALASIIGILAMRGSEFQMSLVIHPAVYAISIISTAVFLFRVFK